MAEFSAFPPGVLIVLAIFILRLILNNKKKNGAGTNNRSAAASRIDLRTGKPAAKSFQERIDEAVRNIQEEQRGTSSLPVPAMPNPAAGGTGDSAGNDPYAFHSLMEQVPERADYDQQASAFGYRPAVSEPVEKEYHLTGFTGFQAVHGLHAGPVEGGRAGGEGGGLPGGLDLFQDATEIRRAIILSEVLGKPKALRSSRHM